MFTRLHNREKRVEEAWHEPPGGKYTSVVTSGSAALAQVTNHLEPRVRSPLSRRNAQENTQKNNRKRSGRRRRKLVAKCVVSDGSVCASADVTLTVARRVAGSTNTEMILANVNTIRCTLSFLDTLYPLSFSPSLRIIFELCSFLI